MNILGIWNKKAQRWLMHTNDDLICSEHPEVIAAYLHNLLDDRLRADVEVRSITEWADEIAAIALYERGKRGPSTARPYEEFRAELGLT